MVTSDFVVDQTPGRAELRSATTTLGALFVMMHGELLMLWWPADSLDFLQQVFVLISTNYVIFPSPFTLQWVIISRLNTGRGGKCKVCVLTRVL